MGTIQEVAQKFALKAHYQQTYGDSDIPYYEHLYDVVSNVIDMYEDESSYQDHSVLQASAWLHDVIEDCGVTPLMLDGEGMGKEVIDIVLAVTKTEGESHTDYLNRIISCGEYAIKLKIADSRANLEATLRSPVSAKQQKRLEKYTTNLVVLNKALLEVVNGKEKEETSTD